ncbi:unnamed protein product [Striga asiatica]|uniref:DUF7950 domain-containing protein n=1 Tax=Striga asiatica TaxID=4170 RepID=A0A5A7QR47_STRAF|nr:unnamed protein product [Striga asiatica]
MLRSPDNNSVMSRIMLRFRPIAPKPASGGGSSSGEADPERWKRAKRKYVRSRGRRGKQSARSKPPSPEISTVEVETPPARAGVTLQLLPERSEEISYSSDLRTSDSGGGGSWPPAVDGGERSPPGIRRVGSTIETLIIVERVTEGYEDVGLGFSDEEWVRSLERDTCPGFISNPRNNVIWVNEAYKKVVGAREKGFVAVWLVVQDVLPQFYPSFACRVRVVQRGGQGQNWNKILPCDVWRMVESHGFAWKLDVNTALSLSI